jgi:hypothetical protein
MKLPSIVATLILALSALPLQAQEQSTETPKIIGLLMYSDTCASCKVLEPKLNAIKKDFTGQPILFTRVDQSNDFTKHQSVLYSSLLGVQQIYAEQGGKTGYMLLIDTKDKKVLGKLIKTQSEAELKATIESALKS